MGNQQRTIERTIIPTGPATLDTLRPYLDRWHELWKVEQRDVEIGRGLTASLKPFLLDLIRQRLADKTLLRHRDHLEMLGGEIICRRHGDPDLAKQALSRLLLTFVEAEGGPLIWPRITESAQRSFDATCRKRYRFLQQQNIRK